MEHYEFKSRIPVDHVRHLIVAFKEGTLLDNKGDNIMCVASALGEVGAMVKSFENPDIVPFASPAITQMTEQELIEQLEDFLAESDGAQISPFMVALIMQALKLLLDYLNK